MFWGYGRGKRAWTDSWRGTSLLTNIVCQNCLGFVAGCWNCCNIGRLDVLCSFPSICPSIFDVSVASMNVLYILWRSNLAKSIFAIIEIAIFMFGNYFFSTKEAWWVYNVKRTFGTAFILLDDKKTASSFKSLDPNHNKTPNVTPSNPTRVTHSHQN